MKYYNDGRIGSIPVIISAIFVVWLLVSPAVSEITPPEKAQTPAASNESPPPEPYVFDPEGKADPFRPFIESLAATNQPRPEVPLTPLQKYSIGQLKLVGVIEGGSEAKALVQDPSNKGYIITTGTLIGPNWGRVVEITSSEVVIVEEIKDALGQAKTQKIVMKLHAPAQQETQ